MMEIDRGRGRPRLAAVALLLAFGASSLAALAQAPQALPAPAGVDMRAPAAVRLAAVELAGNEAIGAEELRAIAARWIGTDVDATDIEELRHRLVAYYVERGFVFAVVRVASAPAADGVLRLHVTEGRLAEVRVRGTDGLAPDYVSQRLNDGNPLNVNDLLDRYRLLLADPLFANINSRLQPGVEPGQAVLDIDIVRATPYQLGVFANNYRPPSIGANAVGVAGWVKNLTGHGDTLEFNVQDSQGSSPLSLSWNVPLLASPTRLNLAYTEGRSAVIEEPMRTIDIKSTSKSHELGVTRPLSESLSRRVVLGLAYVERESRTTLAGVPFSFTPGEPDGLSRTRGLRFSQEWSQVGAAAIFTLRSAFHYGRNNNLGNVADAPDDRYFYWNGQASWLRTVLDNGTQLVVRGGAQLTRNRLLPMERAPVGGVNTVRGYRENQLVRDESLVGTVELKVPLLTEGKAGHNVHLIPFADYGSARNIGGSSESLRSVGVGASWRYAGLSADLYWGGRLRSLPKPANSTEQDRGIHVQLGYQFF